MAANSSEGFFTLYEVVTHWHVRASYSQESIERIFVHAESFGYSCFVYNDGDGPLVKRIELDASRIAYHAFEGWKHRKDGIQTSYIVKDSIILTFAFHDTDGGLLSISSGYRQYVDESGPITSAWGYFNQGDWATVKADFHRYNELVSIFPIIKCRFEQDDYMEDAPRTLGKGVPAVRVLSEMMLSLPEEREAFLNDLLARDYEVIDQFGVEVDPVIGREDVEQSYGIKKGDVLGELIIGPKVPGYWFIPERPYKTRQFGNELAVDTGFYLESTFNMCPTQIFILETECFDLTFP